MTSSLGARVSDIGRCHPGLFVAVLGALAVITTILLLYEQEQTTVVYQNF